MSYERMDAMLDLNATPPESPTSASSVGGDRSETEGSSALTADITTAATVAVPAAQSSSAASMSMPRQSSHKRVPFWE